MLCSCLCLSGGLMKSLLSELSIEDRKQIFDWLLALTQKHKEAANTLLTKKIIPKMISKITIEKMEVHNVIDWAESEMNKLKN